MGSRYFLSILGIIIGILTSLYFHKLSLKKLKIVYTVSTKNLIEDHITSSGDVIVYYNNIKINNLRESVITINNVSNVLIEKKDFSINFPLSLITDSQFLPSYINLDGTKSVAWTLIPDSKNESTILLFDFEYIPKKGSILLSIKHTDSIDVLGELKEGKVVNSIDEKERKKEKYGKLLWVVIILIFFFVLTIRHII